MCVCVCLIEEGEREIVCEHPADVTAHPNASAWVTSACQLRSDVVFSAFMIFHRLAL